MKRNILLPMFASIMAFSMSNSANAYEVVEGAKENEAMKIDLGEYKKETFKTATVKEDTAVKIRLSGAVQTVAQTGESFNVVATQGEWVEVELDDVEAWVPSRYVDIDMGKAYITKTAVNFREEGSMDSEVIDILKLGDALDVVEVSESKWIKVKNGEEEGYVSSVCLSNEAPVIEIEEVVQPNVENNSSSDSSSNGGSNSSNSDNNSSNSGSTSKPDDNANPPASSSSKVQAVLNLAYAKQGSPYVWGAEGPNSFDCSGFTSYVYRNAAGISIPRTSSAQAGYGTTVSKSNLQPGDLVFFNTSGKGVSHVGIYVGGGNMIHSPSSGKTVSVVSINSSYYSARFVTAKRVL